MLGPEGACERVTVLQAASLWSLPWVSMMRGMTINLEGEGDLVLICV